MEHKILEAFTFDDVLLVPGRSVIEPREADVRTALARDFFIQTPLLSAAMDTVTDARLAIALGKVGGFGILHRNQTIVSQAAMVVRVKKAGVRVGAACGPFDVERALALEKVPCLNALHRLKKNNLIVSPAKGFYLIIPPEYQAYGCLPADMFIPDLMRYWNTPYYAGFLSAAQYYGAAHQKPQRFQVVNMGMHPTIRYQTH